MHRSLMLVLLLGLALLDAESARGCREDARASDAGFLTRQTVAASRRREGDEEIQGVCHPGRACLLRLRGAGRESSKASTPRSSRERSERAKGGNVLSDGGKEGSRLIFAPLQGDPSPPPAREMAGVVRQDPDGWEMYPEEHDFGSIPDDDSNDIIGQRPVPETINVFCPGHETYKYYKDGHYTGESYDAETAAKWAKITNIYAPHYVGVPRIFEERDEEMEGTLDYIIPKNRPMTTLDERMKRTFWTPKGGEPESLWMDGLVDPEDDEAKELIEKERKKLAAMKGTNSDFKLPTKSRWLLPIATAAVDRVRLDFKVGTARPSALCPNKSRPKERTS